MHSEQPIIWWKTLQSTFLMTDSEQSKLIISGAVGANSLADEASEESDGSAEMELRRVSVPVESHASRLDRALAACVPEFSRSYLQQLIEAGAVQLNGVTITKVSAKVQAGDDLCVELRPTPQSQAFKPEPMALDIVFQDEYLLVINKPAGLVVHPAPGNWSGTLLNGLLAHDAQASFMPRAGIVHRLDKDTSGVMVVARNLPAHTSLVGQLSQRGVHRQYLAIVVGSMVSGGTANGAIDRHPRDRIRMAVREEGRDAVTHYRLRERFRAHTALECRLETGRTHQIRVHMAHIKYPIIGDPLYGGPLKLPKHATEELIAALRGFRRQALHAETLEFRHPGSGEPVRVSAPVPADMLNLLAALRSDGEAQKQR